jgi:hypothetical protein
MGLFKRKESFDPKAKLAAMSVIGRDWNGLLISKGAKEILELGPYSEISPGEWLYFAFHYVCMPDRRIVISDAACIWMLLEKQVELTKETCNQFMPIPEVLVPYIVPDGIYEEWVTEIQAVDTWFQMSGQKHGWYYQWSWRTDRIKQLLKGEFKNWISK